MVLVFLLTTILHHMQWPQPTTTTIQISTMLTLGLATGTIGRLATTTMNVFNPIRLIQYLLIGVILAAPKGSSTDHRISRRKWPIMDYIWTHVVCYLATRLGHWIEHVTRPSLRSKRRHQQRRTMSAMANHRHITTRLFVLSALAMQANATIVSERQARFDTDSGDIGVDNR